MYNSLGEKQETKQQLKYVGISDFPHIFMFLKY